MSKVFNETTRRMEPEEGLYRVPVENRPWQFKYYSSQEDYNKFVSNQNYSERCDKIVEAILGKGICELPSRYKKELSDMGKRFSFKAAYNILVSQESKIRFVASKNNNELFLVNYIIKTIKTDIVDESKRINNMVAIATNVIPEPECCEPQIKTKHKHDISQFITGEDDD